MPAGQVMLSSSRWRRLIPVAFITYSFAYLDRSNYSLGSAGGLTSFLHLTPHPIGAAGRPVLRRLLPVPGSGGQLCRAARRQNTAVLVAVRLGHTGRTA